MKAFGVFIVVLNYACCLMNAAFLGYDFPKPSSIFDLALMIICFICGTYVLHDVVDTWDKQK